MTKSDIVKMTTASLDIVVPNPVPDLMQSKLDYIEFCVDSAMIFIETEGINLGVTTAGLTDYSAEDGQLVVMYAAWLYRKRGASETYQLSDAMPRMLRFALNNRLMAQKAREELTNVT